MRVHTMNWFINLLEDNYFHPILLVKCRWFSVHYNVYAHKTPVEN